jgi:hypothetical protein
MSGLLLTVNIQEINIPFHLSDEVHSHHSVPTLMSAACGSFGGRHFCHQVLSMFEMVMTDVKHV